jgi:hypothetical protein
MRPFRRAASRKRTHLEQPTGFAVFSVERIGLQASILAFTLDGTRRAKRFALKPLPSRAWTFTNLWR